MPPLDVQGWAIGGVLEYLYNVPALMRSLHGTVAVSYNVVDLYKHNRRAYAWVNDFDAATVEAMFKEADFEIAERVELGTEFIWKLIKRNGDPRSDHRDRPPS
ncbi:hypothetical protein AB4144_56735, partial [Rhizobiaceae sp. 2RAB30]